MNDQMSLRNRVALVTGAGGKVQGRTRRSSYVRFGSKADMCSALGDVALPPKADIASDWAMAKSPRHHRHSPFLISPRRRLNLFPCAL